MLDRTSSVVAVRLVAGTAIVALAVAACGGSSSPAPVGSAAAATPAPTAPPTAAPPTAGGGGTVSNACAAATAVAAAMKNVDHYVATAKVIAAIPNSSAGDLSMDITLKYQKPDRMEVSSGMGAASLFSSITIGKDSWLSMLGSDTWTKADSTASTSDAEAFGSAFDATGLTPLTEIPANVDLPGSSPCVIGYSMKAPAVTGDSGGDPLGALSSASAFVVRVDTSTGLPQSMGFVIDQSKAQPGTPLSMVFVFDYQTPVDIQPPAKVAEPGSAGFPLPSGLVLPSGMTLP